MADRVTTLHKISEFRPQVHMQTLCLKHFIPHSRNYYRAVPKRKWTRQFQQERRVGRFFFKTNSDLAIVCFKHLSRTPAGQYVYLAFKHRPLLSQSLCLLQKSTFGWLLFPPRNICCGVLSLTGIEQICFLLPPLSLMAQALCCL